MIECRHISKHYGPVVAVSGVDLTVTAGVVTGLLGPNGAGKSTLIRMLTSYLLPTTGSVTVCGFDTVTESQRAREVIGYLPESAPAYPEMRVVDFLAYKAGLYSIPIAKRSAAIDRSIERCWLKEVARRRIGQLSKGYRQRVGLAGAILHDPRVVVLDEPTTGLDPAQILELRGLIRSLADGSGDGPKVVLLSSHILAEVQATCDAVVIMARGRVRASGTPAALVASRGSTRYIAVVAPTAGDSTAGADAAAALATVPGVAAVSHEPLPTTTAGGRRGVQLTVTPANTAGDLHEALAFALQRASQARGPLAWLTTELRRQEPTLEEVFMSVVTDVPAPSEAAA
jgi:ABC-2 type transport system ATP-binding protein